MKISEQLRCVFAAEIDEQDGSYLLTVPDREVDLGNVHPGRTYRVALLSEPSAGGETDTATNAEHDRDPPVEAGEHRDVEIDAIGEQGDGIARVERGFVVVVPDTKESERVTIEITDVRENVAFAEVVERLSYYD